MQIRNNKSIALGLSFLLTLAVAAQTIPALINYQGRLTDASGATLPMGNYGIEFRLWDSGTNNSGLVWGQRQSVGVQANGVFNVILGAPGGGPITNPVPAVNDLGLAFTTANRFLGLTMISSNGITLPAPAEILPRQQLLSVPFAVMAQQIADGAVGVNQLAQGAVTSAAITNGAVGAQQIASGAVGSAQIANGAVGPDQIAAGTISTNHLTQTVMELLAPPGTIAAFMGTNPPVGWLMCDGLAVSRTNYPRLFQVIWASCGHGDGSTTFNLPDLRGTFLRGVDGTANRDPDKASRTPSQTGGNPGNLVGSAQPDSFQVHHHGTAINTPNDNPGLTAYGTGTQTPPNPNNMMRGASAGPSPSQNSEAVGANETRPKNVYVNYIIKY